MRLGKQKNRFGEQLTYIQLDRPELVVEEVRKIVNGARQPKAR